MRSRGFVLVAALVVGCPGSPPALDAGGDAGAVSCDDETACGLVVCASAPFCLTCDGACAPCETCTRGRCTPIADGERCTGGTCHEGACCAGCWDGASCLAGDDPLECGVAGAECAACDPFSTCGATGCELTPELGALAGGDVTCAIGASSVVCSGSNRLGQLAIGTTDPVTIPVPVVLELGTVVAGDAADGLTCFLGDEGLLGCAGANNFGQLGQGDTSDRARADAVIGGTRFGHVSVGATHVCAVSREGGLFCWGNNFYGQLGLGDTGARRVPTRVGIDADWRDVAVGLDHTCVLRGANGELQCFGNDNSGQLGDDDNMPRAIAVRIGEGYRQISAGTAHTCAIRDDGGLECWGASPHGQLGLGDTMLRRVPTRVGDGYVQVSAGNGHTCAVRTDGTIHCFGENDDGELGTGTSGTDELSPVEVAGITNAVRVECGSDHSCASLADGTARCWGANRSGQLGTSSPATRASAESFPP